MVENIFGPGQDEADDEIFGELVEPVNIPEEQINQEHQFQQNLVSNNLVSSVNLERLQQSSPQCMDLNRQQPISPHFIR